MEGGTCIFVKRGGVSTNMVWRGYWFICWGICKMDLRVGYVILFLSCFFQLSGLWIVSVCLLCTIILHFWMQLFLSSCLKTSHRSLEGYWNPCVCCSVCLCTEQRNWAFLDSWGSAWFELTLQVLNFSQILHVIISFTLCFEIFSKMTLHL